MRNGTPSRDDLDPSSVVLTSFLALDHLRGHATPPGALDTGSRSRTPWRSPRRRSPNLDLRHPRGPTRRMTHKTEVLVHRAATTLRCVTLDRPSRHSSRNCSASSLGKVWARGSRGLHLHKEAESSVDSRFRRAHPVVASSFVRPGLRHYSSVVFVWPTKCLLGGGPWSRFFALPAQVGSAALVRVRCCTGGGHGER